jgi:predicted GNAT family N-acyltransferase
MNQLTLKVFTYPEEFSQMQAIRRTVFQEEQGVDPSLDFDGLDETAEHILAYLDHQPVGTARVRYLNQQTAKIERLAVLPIARGLGLGKKLMEKAIDLASQKDVEEVVIHAQEYVKGLHQKLGFEQVGDIFYEAGIPHVEMIKKLK